MQASGAINAVREYYSRVRGKVISFQEALRDLRHDAPSEWAYKLPCCPDETRLVPASYLLLIAY